MGKDRSNHTRSRRRRVREGDIFLTGWTVLAVKLALHQDCCARIWQSAHGSAGRRQLIASSARSIFSHSSTFMHCLQLCARICCDEDCRSTDILSVGPAGILPAETQQPGETPGCPTGKMPV